MYFYFYFLLLLLMYPPEMQAVTQYDDAIDTCIQSLRVWCTALVPSMLHSRRSFNTCTASLWCKRRLHTRAPIDRVPEGIISEYH